MAKKKATLLKLNKNLNVLKEREAKFAGQAPLALLNQIDDHEQAIDLTRQAITGEISEQEWSKALKPLLLAMSDGQVVNIEAETYVAGDKVLGDKIITITYEALPPAEARNRADLSILLKNVETTWIKGVLEHSVHEAALLDLGIETRAEAVDHPWQMVLEVPDQSRQVLSNARKIKDIFDEANRLLLILGDPGAGKTTTLLQLARDLIADMDPAFTQPVPVIFNLSTWTDKEQSLADWLSAELSSKYRAPKKLGRSWLEERRILPLFDGLDEVKMENQAACVERINRLAVDYGLQGMVVCSRVKDYMALDVRLQFNSAILLQPLTAVQINEYLDRAGDKLVGLRAALGRDEALQSLAQSPLILNIMSLVYQDRSAEDLSDPGLATDEVRRQHLFDMYIARMFKRKGGRWAYGAEYIKTRLAWLARNMRRHNQEVFLIEGLQPGWLPARRWRLVYVLVSRLLGGLGVGLVVLLIRSLLNSDLLYVDLRVDLINLLIDALMFGLIFGLFVSFIDILRFEWLDKRRAQMVTPSFWRSAINIVIVGLPVGLCVVPIFRVAFDLSSEVGRLNSLSTGLHAGLIFGLVFGLIFGLRGSRQSLTNDIQIVEALRWSWGRALKGGLLGGLIFWLIFGLYNLLFAWLGLSQGIGSYNDLTIVFVPALLGGLSTGMFGGLILGVFYGLRSEIIETKTAPNQGIRLSTRNAVFAGLIFGLIFGLVFGLSSLPMAYSLGIPMMSFGLVSGLIGGPIGGLLAALWYGGLDLIQHYTLRLILIFQGHTPRNYTRFLDCATDLIFLQKVGGGYRFVHRLLLEHFAEMNIERK